ncbi:transmembrane and ubiquitin-like domain-containing protein 1 isoform X1 [Daphnia carinata]|uniref:transmembrane and ubiquitin-like domain-containing protein 1 isoform X1 n=1 Tax=Daphnia carinata TaxID=120202 RepID=UPI00257971E6|nr:transmembrane and ubiquitin-like domain-containing protein 1 isoform X1 [Daphnia carinata]
MSLIEGIGDEVPIFFVLAAIVIVAFMVLAWKSTDVPETPLSLPVLTFTLSQRVIPAPAGLVADDDGPSFPLEDNESNQEISSAENLEVSSDHQTIANSAIQAENNEETLSEVQSMSQETASDKSDEPRRKQMDASPTRTEAIISVKLMYMDDTHRVVESPISMTIGDFKKTHFKNELNANKVVKLIYNGQVLSEESSILSQHLARSYTTTIDRRCVSTTIRPTDRYRIRYRHRRPTSPSIWSHSWLSLVLQDRLRLLFYSSSNNWARWAIWALHLFGSYYLVSRTRSSVSKLLVDSRFFPINMTRCPIDFRKNVFWYSTESTLKTQAYN